MLFNSLQFVFFFLTVLGLYCVLNHKRQNILLLVASYVFYGAWDYRFLALLFATTVVDYWVAIGIRQQNSPEARSRLLAVSIAANLGVLGFFKYFNFFADSFVEMSAMLGFSVSPFVLQIVLPVGISFYTFQSMAYTIDVYRGRLEPSKSLAEFALYVAFFPQLVAGPIERATTLIPQIRAPRILTLQKTGSGLCLILLGLFKKVVIADNLSPTVDRIFSAQSGFTGEDVVIGMLFFAFQIYGDFSGYTDIARGTSRILGFELMSNFKEPYFARNPSDFWRRWHISLSTWLRDYLYIPLGGSLRGRWSTYRNLILTMLLGGLWHGAAWNFVLWGLYHGALLSGHRLIEKPLARLGSSARLKMPRAGPLLQPLSIATMFVFTLYGWLLFRASSVHQVVEMTLALGTWSSVAPLLKALATLLFYAWPVIVLDYLKFRTGDEEPVVLRMSVAAQTSAYLALILLLVMVGQYEGASFIYFQF